MAKLPELTVMKLEEDNYSYWKQQIKLNLRSKKLWGYVSGDKTRPAVTAGDASVAEAEKWDVEDVKAMSIIFSSVSMRQAAHIENLGTSKEMWDKLEEINSDSSLLNKQHIMRQFHTFKHQEGSKLVETYMLGERLAQALRNMSCSIDEDTVVFRIVTALPPRLEAFKMSWSLIESRLATMANLLSKLRQLDLEERIQHDDKTEEEKNKETEQHAFAS